MKFNERMMKYLPDLAEAFLKNKEYHYLRRVAGFGAGHVSMRWADGGLRVVLLPDGETVYNAFFDRGFTEQT